MKKLYVFLVVAMVLGLLVTGGGTLMAQQTQTNVQPTVSVWPPVAKLHSDTPLAILGSGFEPGQELYVMLQHGDGSVSNIVQSLEPTPVVDDGGNFATLFVIARYERVSTEGVYGMMVTDVDYNVLATAPIGLADPDGRSRVGIYPRGAPDYENNPDDPRPLPWCAPFFEYPERP